MVKPTRLIAEPRAAAAEAAAETARRTFEEGARGDSLPTVDIPRARLAVGIAAFDVAGVHAHDAGQFLDDRGIASVPLAAGPEAVVVGLDRAVTYDRLRDAALAVQRGAAFIAANPDTTFPAEDGNWPGAGALAAALPIVPRPITPTATSFAAG